MNETPISIWFPYQEENLKKQSRNEKVRKQLWSLSIDTLFSDFINRCHIFYLRCFLKSRNHMSTCIDFKVFFKCAHFRKFFSSFEFRIQCSSPAKYYLFFLIDRETLTIPSISLFKLKLGNKQFQHWGTNGIESNATSIASTYLVGQK